MKNLAAPIRSIAVAGGVLFSVKKVHSVLVKLFNKKEQLEEVEPEAPTTQQSKPISKTVSKTKSKALEVLSKTAKEVLMKNGYTSEVADETIKTFIKDLHTEGVIGQVLVVVRLGNKDSLSRYLRETFQKLGMI